MEIRSLEKKLHTLKNDLIVLEDQHKGNSPLTGMLFDARVKVDVKIRELTSLIEFAEEMNIDVDTDK